MLFVNAVLSYPILSWGIPSCAVPGCPVRCAVALPTRCYAMLLMNANLNAMRRRSREKKTRQTRELLKRMREVESNAPYPMPKYAMQK